VTTINEQLYFQITDVWKRFCELHFDLFNLTCDEYTYLLQSNLEQIDGAISRKESIIKEISFTDSKRQELIAQINQSLPTNEKISKVKELLTFGLSIESDLDQNHLSKYNLLLIDLIEKIQAQNKRNQLFLNKAIISLREIRQDATGNKNYNIYNGKGALTQEK
jgi:flagellar biosynthesis/type III secretory pathway chaperone